MEYKVKVIPVVVDAFGTIRQDLKKRLEQLKIRGRIETIQTIASLKSARILKRVRGNLKRQIVTSTKSYILTNQHTELPSVTQFLVKNNQSKLV